MVAAAIFLVALAHLPALGDASLVVTSSVPLIEDAPGDYHIVLSEGGSVQLDCTDESMGHIWELPENTDLVGYYAGDFHRRVEKTDAMENYTRLVHIKDAKVTDAGLYTCRNHNSRSKWNVYVYVKSPAFFLESTVQGLFVNDDFTIPCRSSRPLAIFEKIILRVDGEHWPTADSSYDSKIGFKIQLDTIKDNITRGVRFECVLEGWEDVSVHFLVTMKEESEDGNPPVLSWRKSTEWPYIGGPLIMPCRLEQIPKLIGIHKMTLNVTCPRCQDITIGRSRSYYSMERIINITELLIEDAGTYKCEWYEDDTLIEEIEHHIMVASKMHQIRINSQSQVPHALMDGDSLALTANFSVFPDVSGYSLKWIREYTSLQTLSEEAIKQVVIGSHVANSSIVDGFHIEELHLSHMSVNMSGNYILTIAHGDSIHTVKWTVKIKSNSVEPRILVTPTIHFNFFDEEFYHTGSKIKVGCLLEGYEPANIRLSMKEADDQIWNELTGQQPMQGTFEIGISLSMNETKNMDFKCETDHGEKNKTTIRKIRVADADPSLDRTIVKPRAASENEISETIYEGDKVTLHCKAPFDPNWQLDLRYEDDEFVSLETVSEKVGNMWHRRDVLRDVKEANQGNYTCVANNKKDGRTRPVATSSLSVIPIQRPILLESTLPSITANYLSNLTLRCNFSGSPTPLVAWYKTNILGMRERLKEGGSELLFAKLTVEDQGNYECSAINRAGNAFKKIDLKVPTRSRTLPSQMRGISRVVATLSRTARDLNRRAAKPTALKQTTSLTDEWDLNVEGAPEALPLYAWLIIVCVILLLTVAVCIFVRLYAGMRKTSKEQQKALNHLNDRLMKGSQQPPLLVDGNEPLEYRAQRTPYNNKYEIDEKCLVLEANSLGEGQFGIVKRGELYVKAACRTTRNTPLPVAVKIAKSATKGAVELLMEELKILIALDERSQEEPNPNVLALVGASTSTFSKSGVLTVVFELCELGDLNHFLHAHRPRFVDELATVAAMEHGDYLQPETEKIRYKSERTPVIGDCYENVPGMVAESEYLAPQKKDTLCTSDLISFSMQVANGMDYLARMNCIHRDLAARNVLLTKDRVVKVADFGLTKIEPKTYYKIKKRTIPLPVKWLALETLLSNKFTPETDIWSFGVLLYEIFTLGDTPYPGRSTDFEKMTEYLLDGGRMDRPRFCHPMTYAMMRRSWDEDPATRPSFAEWFTFLKNELSLASPPLLHETKDNMEKAARQLNNLHIYRREGQDGRYLDKEVIVAMNEVYQPRSIDDEEGVDFLLGRDLPNERFNPSMI